MGKAAECISFVNHKGGTGRTTSCLSIAGYLAKNDSKVLMVDFDPKVWVLTTLRDPLRSLDGFSQVLLEGYYDKLDEPPPR
jgi:cellulose biosynthesis protein BcsQ